MNKRTIKRKFDNTMARALKSMKLSEGSHSEAGQCVMEAVAVITGQNKSDHPVCVSDLVRTTAITINDSAHSERSLQELKSIIPELMGTAPVVLIEDWRGEQYMYEVTDENNSAYVQAEKRRKQIIIDTLNAKGFDLEKYTRAHDYGWVDSLADFEGDDLAQAAVETLGWREQKKLLCKLANVAHFNE